MIKQVDSQIDRKWTVASSNKFYDKIKVIFCLETGKYFFEEVSF